MKSLFSPDLKSHRVFPMTTEQPLAENQNVDASLVSPENLDEQRKSPQRRKVNYHSIPSMIEDVEKLASGRFKTTGNWSFPQILIHYGRSVESSFDGFGFRANWFVRTFVKLFMKKSLLTEPMATGYPILKGGERLMPEDDCSFEAALNEFRHAVARFETESPSAEHPVLGKLSSEEWIKFHLRHAELHFSFVWPD